MCNLKLFKLLKAMFKKLNLLTIFFLIVILKLLVLSCVSTNLENNSSSQDLKIYTLPKILLGQIQLDIRQDRQIYLGGIGSGLWRNYHDTSGHFWMITDRGPNAEIKVDSQKLRTFPIPEFNPLILYVKLSGTQIEIIKKIPIIGQNGKGVTGLPNIEGYDETPYTFDGKQQLKFNPNGLDTEGLVQTSKGDFWVVDEYSPSLIRIAADGKVIKRYVPVGLKLKGTDYPLAERLPAILLKRKVNRGFEGIALSPDEKYLFIAMQSPLSNPNKKIGDLSRITRILAFEVASERIVAEYVYIFDIFSEFDRSAESAAEMKLSGLAAILNDKLLVLERTDKVAKIYAVELSKASNILNTKWDDLNTSPALESLSPSDLTTLGVVALPKTLVIDLAKISAVPEKIEGITIIDEKTIAIANDNDFDIGKFDQNGNNQGNDKNSKIVIIKLNERLKNY